MTVIYSSPSGNGSIKLAGASYDTKTQVLSIPEEAYKALTQANIQVFDYMLQRSFPETVTDAMGSHINYEGLLYCSTGDDTVSFANNTLTWDFTNESVITPSQDPEDYEQISDDDAFSLDRAYQLVYKIRLNTADTGFTSCGGAMNATSGNTVNPTNGNTVLRYHTDKSNTTATASFSVPSVRGLQYEIGFAKKDQNGSNISDAKFTLTDAGGNTVQTITTNGSSSYSFSSLPAGSYTLTEDPPYGYAAETDTWSIPLNYTTNPSVLTQSGTRMKYAPPGVSGTWTITNRLGDHTVRFVKVSNTGAPVNGAAFSLCKDLAMTVDAGFNLHASDENGYLTDSAVVLPYGTYYMRETVAPAGYQPIDGVIRISCNVSGVTAYYGGKVLTSVEENGVYILSIENQMLGFPLPETGGTGAMTVYALGSLLLITGITGLMVKCRKRRKHA